MMPGICPTHRFFLESGSVEGSGSSRFTSLVTTYTFEFGLAHTTFRPKESPKAIAESVMYRPSTRRVRGSGGSD